MKFVRTKVEFIYKSREGIPGYFEKSPVEVLLISVSAKGGAAQAHYCGTRVRRHQGIHSDNDDSSKNLCLFPRKTHESRPVCYLIKN